MNKILLKELCLADGHGKYGIPAPAEDFDTKKFRYLRISDISDDGNLLNEAKKSVSSANAEKYLLKEGDIVFARTGNSTGRAYYHEDKFGELVYAGFLIKYSLDFKKVNPKYLKYYTLSTHYKTWVENLSVGSTRGNINAKTFSNCLIPLPSRKQQDFLVSVLSTFDKKIDLNNHINAELESITKLLYEYWFVQFDFPNSDGKPYKSSGNVMVYNEVLKRKIPASWEVKMLGEMVDLIVDNVLPSEIESTTPYIGLEHIPRKCITLSEWETAAKVDSAKGQFKKNDILFGKIRPYFHKVGVALTDGITSTDTIVLRPKDSNFHGVILQTVFSEHFVEVATKTSAGTKMPRASWRALKEYPVIIPPKDLLLKFENISRSSIHKIENSVKQNHKLAKMRDWLLPMLMNGQVKVE